LESQSLKSISDDDPPRGGDEALRHV
jgi:hypothetical protein